jgi:hypothetical protein
MTEAGARIPAWKRLGLALKNEAQSGVTVPEPTTSQSDVQHQAPYDSRNGSHDHAHSSNGAAVNGEPSNLGKRKHQHDTAEDGGQTAKKGKSSPTETDTDRSVEIHSSAPSIEVAEVQTSTSEPSSTAAAQPKGGDPNYRRKKDKPKKNKKRNHEDAPVAPAPVQAKANHDSQFLSPDLIVPKSAQPTLLASTEINEQLLAPALTPQRRETSKQKSSSGSPSAIDRRKSVSFTPDTKKLDGSSGQDLFKNWVAEQNGVYLNFDYVDPGDDPVPAVVPEKPQEAPAPEVEKQKEKAVKAPAAEKPKSVSPPATKPATKPDTPAPATTTPAKGKKKDPSIYVSYLTQYHEDRAHWKFNKAKQNDVVDNALNIFRIPNTHSEALLEYVQGLKGAGVVERLKGRCESTVKELDEQEAKDTSMDDTASRKAAHDEALKTRVAKEQKRRKVEGDVEDLSTHPHGDGYIRRLRRERALALLNALGRAAPILPAAPANGINPMMKNVVPVRDSKKRKRRGDISSDESSSDSSSSDDSSSSESESDNDSEGSDSDSSSSAASASKKSDSSDSDSARESRKSDSSSDSDSD